MGSGKTSASEGRQRALFGGGEAGAAYIATAGGDTLDFPVFPENLEFTRVAGGDTVDFPAFPEKVEFTTAAGGDILKSAYFLEAKKEFMFLNSRISYYGL